MLKIILLFITCVFSYLNAEEFTFDHDGLNKYLNSNTAKNKNWTEQWFDFVSSFNGKVSPEIINTVLRYGNYKKKMVQMHLILRKH